MRLSSWGAGRSGPRAGRLYHLLYIIVVFCLVRLFRPLSMSPRRRRAMTLDIVERIPRRLSRTCRWTADRVEATSSRGEVPPRGADAALGRSMGVPPAITEITVPHAQSPPREVLLRNHRVVTIDVPTVCRAGTPSPCIVLCKHFRGVTPCPSRRVAKISSGRGPPTIRQGGLGDPLLSAVVGVQ